MALLLPSTPLYLVAYLAAARLGAVTTGINVRYRRTEIGHVLRQSGAKLLLAVTEWHDADFRATVDELRPDLPELAHVEWLAPDAIRASTRAVVDGLGGTPPSGGPAPDDPITIVFTSGTTGAPKGAWFTHRNLLALAAIESRRHAAGGPRFTKHLAAGLSFAHVGTMARLAIQIGTVGGSIIQDAFDTAVMLETIERERLEHLGCFPTQAIMLLESGAPAPRPDVARRCRWRRTVVAGADPRVQRRRRDRCPLLSTGSASRPARSPMIRSTSSRRRSGSRPRAWSSGSSTPRTARCPRARSAP